MVAGIEKFRDHFAGHEDRYAIIGGAACDLLFDAAGLPFRATKDIDMVLCVEVVDPAFGAAFKAFLDAGGYQARERSDGRKEILSLPQAERPKLPVHDRALFAQARDPRPSRGCRAHAHSRGRGIVSLSAILLDEGYYETLQAAKRKVDGVVVIDETLLIPFKARAFLDMTARAEAGEKIDGKNIKKHRNDVFRLVQLLPTDASIKLADPIREDLRKFLELAQADDTLDPRAFDVPLSRDEAIGLLRSVYDLN